MTLRFIARLGLFCLLILAACAPNANLNVTPTAAAPTEAPTQRSTRTPRPTATPRPSRTPTVAAETRAAQATAAASTPATPGTPGTAAAQPTTANPPAGGAAADKYTYLGQSIPDRSQFLPNRTVTITWTVKNSGTTGWTKEYALRYFAGPKAAKDVYFFTKDVPVNDTINFIVTFTTPAAPGEYDMWFKLTNSAGQNFGDLDLVYTVSNSPVKATSTPVK